VQLSKLVAGWAERLKNQCWLMVDRLKIDAG